MPYSNAKKAINRIGRLIAGSAAADDDLSDFFYMLVHSAGEPRANTIVAAAWKLIEEDIEVHEKRMTALEAEIRGLLSLPPCHCGEGLECPEISLNMVGHSNEEQVRKLLFMESVADEEREEG